MGLAFAWAGLAGGSEAAESFDHVAWDPLPAEIRAGHPFEVTVRAMNGTGQPVPGSAGTVTLSGFRVESRPAVVITEFSVKPVAAVECMNVGTSPVDLSGWRILAYASRAFRRPVTEWRLPAGSTCAPGTVFTLQTGYPASTAYPAFVVNEPLFGSIVGPDLGCAVLLCDATGRAVDVVVANDYPLELVHAEEPLPAGSWLGANLGWLPTTGATFQRVGGVNSHDARGWVIAASSLGVTNSGLQLPFASGEQAFVVQPGVLTLEHGVAHGLVTVRADAGNVRLRADDRAGHPGDSPPFNLLPGYAVGLELISAVREASPSSHPGAVVLPQPVANEVVVRLTCSRPREIVVPAAVTIPAGATRAEFMWENHDDAERDGTQTITVVADAEGYLVGTAEVQSVDNETSRLWLNLPVSVTEGQFPAAARGWVSLDWVADAPVQVRLLAEPPGLLELAATVVIPTGSSSNSFALPPVDDGLLNGERMVTVQAVVEGWEPATQSVTVRDNETATLTLGANRNVWENAGIIPGGFSLALGGILQTDVVVNVQIDPPGRLAVPEVIRIPAGQGLVQANLAILDDAQTNGLVTVRLDAIAPGLLVRGTVVNIYDDDAAALIPVDWPAAVIVDAPQILTVAALNVDNLVIPQYSGPVAVKVIGPDGSTEAGPFVSSPFTNGYGQCVLRIPRELRGATLEIRDAAGHAIRSGAFDVSDLRQLNLGVADVLSEPSAGRLFVSFGAAGGTNQGVAVLDPETGELGPVLGLGGPAGRLALSDDGRRLYVGLTGAGRVAVVNVETWREMIRFSLAGPGEGPFEARDLRVLPGHSESVLVERQYGSGSAGTAVYDDGLRRGQIVTGLGAAELVPTPQGDEFFSFGAGLLCRLILKSTGVFLDYASDLSPVAPDQPPWSPVWVWWPVLDEGQLYLPSGHLVQPYPRRVLHTFPSAGPVCVEPERNRVYFLGAVGAQRQLQTYSRRQRTPTGQVNLVDDADYPGRLVRWGEHGLAFNDSLGHLHLLRTDLVPGAMGGDVAVAMDPPPALVTVGQPFRYSVRVSNTEPAVVTGVLVDHAVSGGTRVMHVQTSQGTATNGVNGITFDVGTLAAGAVAVLEVVVEPVAPGQLVSRVRLVRPDRVAANDTASVTNRATFGVAPPAVTAYALDALDLAYDSKSNRLCVSQGWFAGEAVGSLRFIDLASGELSAPWATPGRLRRLGPTAGGGWLHGAYFIEPLDRNVTSVGDHLARINLATLQVDHTDRLDEVLDLAAWPENPAAVMVARTGPQHDVVLFEGGRVLKRSPGELYANRLAFAADNPRELFACPPPPSPVLYRFRIDDTSSLVLEDQPRGVLGEWAHSFATMSGRLISDLGDVVDTATMTRTARWDATGEPVLDPARDRAYFLNLTPECWRVSAFRLSDGTPLWHYPMPELAGVPARFLGCGPGLIALNTEARQVFILNTDLLPGRPVANLRVASTASHHSASIGKMVTFTTGITNVGPASASEIWLTNTLAGAVEVVGASVSQGDWHMTNGAVVVAVGEVPAGGYAVFTLTVRVTAGGTLTNTVEAFAREQDPQERDNVSAIQVSVPVNWPGELLAVDLAVADLTADPTSGRLYASRRSAGGEGDAILALNGRSLAIEQVVPTGPAPGRLAISADGRFLYVAVDGEPGIRRFRLPELTEDLHFVLPAGRSVDDLQVAPNDPEVVAVSLASTLGGSPRHVGVYLYAHGVARPWHSAIPVWANSLAFASDGARLYAYNSETSAYDFHTFDVSEAGLTLMTSTTGLISGSDIGIKQAAGRIYADSGDVVNPAGPVKLGRFPGVEPNFDGGSGSRVEPDPAHGATYFVMRFADAWQLQAFDNTTWQPVGSLVLSGLRGRPANLVRADASRVAFRTTAGQVYLAPLASVSTMDLAVKLEASRPSAGVGEELVVQATVTNAGPAVALRAYLELNLPANLAYGDTEVSRGTFFALNDRFGWRIDALEPGGGATIRIRLAGSAAGWAALRASTGGDGFESRTNNNVANLVVPVTDSAEDGATVWRSLPAEDFVYCPQDHTLYVGLATADAILPIDAETLMARPAIEVGGGPGALALSDDGQFLYISVPATGEVVRVALASQAVDLRFTLGPDPTRGQRAAFSLAVLPGRPRSVAVARGGYASGFNPGIVVYDDEVARPGTFEGPSPGYYWIGFGADAHGLYAAGRSGLHWLRIGDTGVGVVTPDPVPGFGSRFRFARGLIYSEHGGVLNPATLAVEMAFPIQGPLAVDEADGWALWTAGSGNIATLQGWDLGNAAFDWSLPLAPLWGTPTGVEALGIHGVAVRTDRQELMVVRPAAFAGPPRTDLTLTPTWLLASVTVGGPYTAKLALVNQGLWVARAAAVSIPIPDGTRLDSRTSTIGEWTVENGVAWCRTGDLAPGQGVSLTVVLSPTNAVPFTFAAAAQSSVSDDNPGNNLVTATVEVTPLLVVSLESVTVTEGGAGYASVPVRLSRAATIPVSANMQTVDGTAVAGTDYRKRTTTVLFSPGTTVRSFDVTVLDDSQPEAAETFGVVITAIAGAAPGITNAIVTILDNERPVFAARATGVREGNAGSTPAGVEVTLSAPFPNPVSVSYTTVPDSAVAGVDFAARSGVLEFPPGVTNRIIPLQVFGDTVHEADESFWFVLRPPADGATPVNAIAITIVDDDPALPPVFGEIAVVGQQTRLKFSTTAGVTYRLEVTGDLVTPVWTTTLSGLAGTGGEVTVQLPIDAEAPARFYRVRAE